MLVKHPAKALTTLWMATLACGNFLGGTPTPVPNTPTPELRSAQLSDFRNAVESQSEQDAEWQPAQIGQTILTGGGARTEDESRARMDISDGTIYRMGANTIFTLEEFSPGLTDPVTVLNLDAGKIWALVTAILGSGRFEIETPVGVSGVRGSLMSVEYNPVTNQMIVTCLEGLCYLRGASGATTNLVAGEQSEILGIGLDPTPAHPMDDAQLMDWEREFPEARAAVATATAAPRPTATPTAQSACDHPFLPLRAGTSWQKQRRTATVEQTVETIEGDLNTATAIVSEKSDSLGIAYVYAWSCTPEGITYFRLEDVTNLAATVLTFYSTVDAFHNVDSSAEVAALQYTLSDVTGVSLPPLTNIKPGATWEVAYTLRYEARPAALPEAYINYVVELSEIHLVGEEQELVTAAGTFTVTPIVIQTIGTETYEFYHGPRGFGPVGPISEPVDTTTTVYYGKDIGIVNLEWVSGATTFITELVSYNIP